MLEVCDGPVNRASGHVAYRLFYFVNSLISRRQPLGVDGKSRLVRQGRQIQKG